MDELQQKNLIVVASRKNFARNVLTVIKPSPSTVDLAKPADLLDARVAKIVIGNPKTVPVGQYSEESLKALGLWDRVQPKLILAENVRQALDYVARGEVDAGFVYTTDAAIRRGQIVEAFRPPEDTYRPVVYPVAIVAGSKHQPVSQAFIDLLLGREGQPCSLGWASFRLPPPRDDHASATPTARGVGRRSAQRPGRGSAFHHHPGGPAAVRARVRARSHCRV